MPFFSPSNSGTVTVTGTVAVSNFPAVQPASFDLGMKFKGWTAFGGQVMTSLASGNAMAFALVDISAESPLWESALVYLQTRMGAAAPTAGAAIEYYLVRRTDVAGESDDAVPDAGVAAGANFWDQADLIAAFNVTATANKFYRGVRDLLTFGPLGNSRWGIGSRNGSSQALSATAGDHIHKHNMYAKRAA